MRARQLLLVRDSAFPLEPVFAAAALRDMVTLPVRFTMAAVLHAGPTRPLSTASAGGST